MTDADTASRTSTLWEQLFKAPSVEQFLSQNANAILQVPFPAYLNALCEQRGEVPEHVIKRANIERSFGHSIFRGDRKPSRDTVLQLAFGFGADVELAQSLLKHAGHSALYPRVRRDVVISYCLLHGRNLVQTQQVLSELTLPLIGGARK